MCRVTKILASIRASARRYNYAPVDGFYHKTVRDMTEFPNCCLCNLTLNWDELGWGKTPHLHHDHVSGKPIGFTHAKCNPLAMENEIDRLKKEIEELKELCRTQSQEM